MGICISVVLRSINAPHCDSRFDRAKLLLTRDLLDR